MGSASVKNSVVALVGTRIWVFSVIVKSSRTFSFKLRLKVQCKQRDNGNDRYGGGGCILMTGQDSCHHIGHREGQ